MLTAATDEVALPLLMVECVMLARNPNSEGRDILILKLELILASNLIRVEAKGPKKCFPVEMKLKRIRLKSDYFVTTGLR